MYWGTVVGEEVGFGVIKLTRLHVWDESLRPFIRKFIVFAGEIERSEESVVDQIKNSFFSNTHGLWFVKKDDVVFGYLFAQASLTEYHTWAILVHQAYFDTQMGFRLWKVLDEFLFKFGEPWGASELFFLTRRDPNAFIRLLNDDWAIDSFILRKKKNVPREKNISHEAL